MPYRAIRPSELTWITRPHGPDEPARSTAELSELADFKHVRGNFWRYEPGASGKRHREPDQDETFVVISGTLTMYLGEPPERVEVPAGGIVHVQAGTPLQSANQSDEDLLVYVYGAPLGETRSELLASAI
jgi:quercetin dioxygenase-like cupin family protein